MKKARINSPIATQQDLQDMTHYIVTTMNEMFAQQNKRLDKLEERQDEFEENQNNFERNLTEIKESQQKQLEVSLQVVDELKVMRQEQTAVSIHNVRADDTLENHEARIATLEKNFALA